MLILSGLYWFTPLGRTFGTIVLYLRGTTPRALRRQEDFANSIPVVGSPSQLGSSVGNLTLDGELPEHSPPPPPPLRVLVMDGGGMKGRNLLVTLREIEKRAGRPVSELFDLVCGTSIGGCGALFIAQFGANATNQAETAFKNLQSRCFANQSKRRLWVGVWLYGCVCG